MGPDACGLIEPIDNATTQHYPYNAVLIPIFLAATKNRAAAKKMSYSILLLLILIIEAAFFNKRKFETKRKLRRDYYRNEYLKSDACYRTNKREKISNPGHPHIS
jgi:hypothetical protein